jgi:translocation and assembly module TamB
MRRIRRGLLVVLIVVLVAGVVLVVAARSYLASGAAAARVAAGLETQYGGPVQVGKVEIGLSSSTVQDLKLYEEGAEPGAEPWATFHDIQADVSLPSLASGAPHVRRLDVSGADLTLRFDKAGHLLNRLPKQKQTGVPLPDVRLRQGRITIDQVGRPPFVVGGVEAEVRSAEGRLVLTGTVHDERWGDWVVTGNVDPASGASTGTLKCASRIHVTQPMLTDLPFVGASVWANVQAEGDTPVVFTLGYQPEKHAVHYRVELEPENTHVHVTSIVLTAEQARGKVIIEDAVVRLEKVQGKTANGTLATDAVLDFRSTPNRLTFTVSADGLELAKLPKRWRVPSQLAGRLTGHAELVVLIRDGHVRTNGEGEGEITHARVMGLPSRPIRLRLYSEGEGFHFGTPKPPEGGRSGALLPHWAAATVVLLGAPPAGQPAASVFTPVEAANRVSTGVLDAAGGLTDAGMRLLRAVPTHSRLLPGGPKPATPATSYLEANIALDDVDLAKLIEHLTMKLPVPVSGRVSVRVRVAFPIDTPGDIKAYRVNGTAMSRQLSVAGVELRQLQAKVHYADGVLYLEELRGRVPSARQSDEGPAVVGSFAGSARLDVALPGEATASLTFDRVPLDRAPALLPGPAPRAEGTVSGTVAARAPAARLRDVTTWAANGHLETDRLVVYGLTLASARADVRLEHGELSLPAVAGKLADASLRGSGRLALAEPYRYHAHLDVKGSDLAALEHLVPDLRPPVAVGGRADVGADVDGTLRPLTWDAKGTAEARELHLDALTAANVTFHWDTTPDHLEVTDLRARLYRGDVTGTATVPLGILKKEGTKPAPGRVSLDFKDLDVGAFVGDLLAAATPAGERTGGRRAPVPIQGQADGTLTATLPVGERDLSAKVELRSSRLRVQGLLAERVRGTLGYRKGVCEYHLEGAMAGGTIKLDGTAPARGSRPSEPPPSQPPEASRSRDVILVHQPAAPPGEGRLRVEGAQLGQLLEGLGVPAARFPLRGTVDLDLPYRQESIGAAPTGVGRLTVRRLRWHQEELTGELTSSVQLTARQLRIADLSAVVGQGVLRGRAAFPLRSGERGWFSVALDNVDAARLMAPWPDVAGRVEGTVEVTLRGTLDHEWAGSGEVTLLRGRVLGVDVVDWRLPFDFLVAPSRGAGQINVRDTSGQVALGRVTGRASLSFDSINRLEGTVRFVSIDLPTLLRQSTEQSQFGPGKVSGRIEFAANDLRSVNDLSATIEASFQQTQSMNYPVLQQIAPFLGPGQSSTSFRNGDLRARLDRGVIRVQRLTLSSSTLQLFADGTVTLEGRLNLNVTGNTGQVGYNPTFLRFLGLRIPAVGPIPVSLLLEASTYLSNRTVHLHVAGTLRSPSVQVEPVSLLSEEAIRFFVNRTTLPVP